MGVKTVPFNRWNGFNWSQWEWQMQREPYDSFLICLLWSRKFANRFISRSNSSVCASTDAETLFHYLLCVIHFSHHLNKLFFLSLYLRNRMNSWPATHRCSSARSLARCSLLFEQDGLDYPYKLKNTVNGNQHSFQDIIACYCHIFQFMMTRKSKKTLL